MTGPGAVKLMAVLASGLCLFAGAFLLIANYGDEDIRLLAGWIGIFFIGMSMFVGPTLWLLADLWSRDKEPAEPERPEESV